MSSPAPAETSLSENAAAADDPSPADDDVINSVAIDEMSVVFDMVASKSRSVQKRSFDEIDRSYTAKYLLSGTPSDLLGGPIEMCPEVVQANAETIRALEALSVPVVSTSGPVTIPISTVEDDSRELVFGREGVPLCDRGDDCMAHMVPGHPAGPLHAYRGPGHDPDQNACLLCLRHELAMIVALHKSNNSKVPLGLLPPFANPVDTPGGYRSAFCGVKPEDTHVISGGVYICGAGVGMKKMYNPYTKKWHVDQSVAVYGGTGNFFF